MKMRSKNFLVFFLTIVSVLFLVNTVSAADIADIYSVKINGIQALYEDVSIIAGETITIKVYFDAWEDASDIRIKAELEGEKVDVSTRTGPFDTEDGYRYKKTLTLKVPYELKDQVSDDVTLTIKIWNGEYKTEEEIVLRVQRPSYSADIMSISVSQTAEAGETLPINIVLKNIGYNDLDDMYVTVKIPSLGIERTSYFGDLVAVEYCEDDDNYCHDDDTDTTSGRFYLQIPYDVKSGIYTIEVDASNGDLIMSESAQIVIQNDFSTGNVIVSSLRKNGAVGGDIEYSLLIANPTNKLKAYRIVSESSGELSSSVSQSVIAIPAGSSKTVTITANAGSTGEYDFDVHIFSGEKLVESVTLTANVSGSSLTPIVVLTIVLTIIFLVLLVVLIVLLGKKPEKSEEFGESYY